MTTITVERELLERCASVLNGRLKQELRTLLAEQPQDGAGQKCAECFRPTRFGKVFCEDHSYEQPPARHDQANEVRRLREALEHIREYWNRDQNETAMADALWHIIEVADKAVSTSSEGV